MSEYIYFHWHVYHDGGILIQICARMSDKSGVVSDGGFYECENFHHWMRNGLPWLGSSNLGDGEHIFDLICRGSFHGVGSLGGGLVILGKYLQGTKY